MTRNQLKQAIERIIAIQNGSDLVAEARTMQDLLQKAYLHLEDIDRLERNWESLKWIRWNLRRVRKIKRRSYTAGTHTVLEFRDKNGVRATVSGYDFDDALSKAMEL